MISFKTSDCRQKCGNSACNLHKLTAVFRDYWRQRGQAKSSHLYRCCQIYGEIDCTYRLSTAENSVRSNKRTVHGAGRTDCVRHFPYGVRLTPYQAGTMCATRPPHSRYATDSLGASRPQSPVEGDDVYGERYTNIRPHDGKGKTDNTGEGKEMRIIYNRICKTKSIGLRTENGSARCSFYFAGKDRHLGGQKHLCRTER